MRRLTLLLVAALCSVFVLSACGDDDEDSGRSAAPAEPAAAKIQPNPANAKTTITVGSKNFTEQKILGEIYAQAFEAAGYKVQKELNLGDEQVALESLKGGQITGYPEYTGTILGSFLDVKAADLPTDEAQAYEQAKAGLAKDGIAALPQTPFTNSNEVGILRKTAEELGVSKISDLADKAGDLTLYGSPECRTRRDCLLGLRETYGLRFKQFTPVDLDQRHEVLESGDADLSIVFTTDPQIQRNDEVLLEDDKGIFPPYNSTFLIKQADLDEAGPDLGKAVEAVNATLDAKVIQELIARVDLDKETPQAAASDYLTQFKIAR